MDIRTPTWTPGLSTYRMDVKTYMQARALQGRTWGMGAPLVVGCVNATFVLGMYIAAILGG